MTNNSLASTNFIKWYMRIFLRDKKFIYTVKSLLFIIFYNTAKYG